MKFGTDGVRGVALTELTTTFATQLGRAAARVLGADGVRTVAVGGDTRESTPELDRALCLGFAVEGFEVVRLGVAPTPLVAFEAQRREAIGAVVSASHNPWSDNGIKLFARGGVKLTDDVEQRIEAELSVLQPLEHLSIETARRNIIDVAADHQAYIDHIVGFLDGLRLDGMKVVLDGAHGAAHEIGPDVLRAAGAEVIVIANDPDGRNINDGCGATAPGLVAAAVRAHGADVGIALDGDADRLIAVDHTGTVVDGDHIIAIVANDLRARGALRHDAVVVTVMTNLGFRLAMQACGIDVVETAVGDRYVLAALAEGGYSLGGEQSGHVIFADHATTGDGMLTAVALLDAVKRDGRPLAQVAAATMTSLPQVLVNVPVARRMPDIAEVLRSEIDAAQGELGDTGRILVRASGTEPLVRVMVEAPTDDVARRVANRVAEDARRLAD